MRFISYSLNHRHSWGAVVDRDGQQVVVDLSCSAPSLKAAIESQCLQSASINTVGDEPSIDEVTVLPPIT